MRREADCGWGNEVEDGSGDRECEDVVVGDRERDGERVVVEVE